MNYSDTSKVYPLTNLWIAPSTFGLVGTPTHLDIYGYAGLKCYSGSNIVIQGGYINDGVNTKSIDRSQFGQIVYLSSTDAYYKCYQPSGSGVGKPQYAILPGLTTGIPTYAGITSSGGLSVTGIISGSSTGLFGGSVTSSAFSSSGISQFGTLNLTTDLTVANGGTGRSSFTEFSVLIGAGGNSIYTSSTPAAGTVFIGSAAKPLFSSNLYLSGNIENTGTASFGATTVSSLRVSDLGNNLIPYYNGSKLVDSYLTQGADTITCGSGFTASSILNNGILNVSGMSNLAGLTSSAGINISSGNLGFSTTNTISVVGGQFVFDGDTNGALQIQSGVVYIGDKTGDCACLTQSSTRLVSDNGFENGNSSFTVNANGDLQCNSLKQTSLRSLKHDIINIPDPQLDNIMKLRPVTFLYNDDAPQDINDVKVRQAGFIAEQVQQIYPQIAWYKDGQLAGLQYQRLTAYLVKAVQQLNLQVKSLRAQLDAKS